MQFDSWPDLLPACSASVAAPLNAVEVHGGTSRCMWPTASKTRRAVRSIGSPGRGGSLDAHKAAVESGGMSRGLAATRQGNALARGTVSHRVDGRGQ